ncbi:MAG: hypothetical protein FJX57_11540, partial [Alphaproteobacteria bacterium]|nr:hypothetical protein [Alphaproteobacteria bacterium]
MTAPRFVALTERGAALARRLQPSFPGSMVHGLARRVAQADTRFDDARAELGALFAGGEPIVAIMAAGIVVRSLAPMLADKLVEPPVLVLAEDGSAVVPLLGGHGGANALAARIAAALGIAPAITTAGELVHGVALDDPPRGWRIATPGRLKATAAALVAGEPIDLVVEASDAAWLIPSCREAIGGVAAKRPGRSSVALERPLTSPSRASRVPPLLFASGEQEGMSIVVTDRAGARGEALVYHPPVLVLGVGCERGAAPEEVVAFARAVLAEAGLAEGAIAGVASIDIKMDEAAVHALAGALDVPVRFFTAAELAREEARLATPSDYVKATVGVAGVAEAAALAAAGPDSRLVLAKRIGPRATV